MRAEQQSESQDAIFKAIQTLSVELGKLKGKVDQRLSGQDNANDSDSSRQPTGRFPHWLAKSVQSRKM
jgi:hypothetical protein